MSVVRSSLLLLAVLQAGSARLAAQGRTVGEREPNDAPASAQIVRLGDTLTGAIDPRRDLDYFTFDVPAGTLLRIDRTGSYGSATFSRIELNLVDVDGQSSLVWLLEDHDYMAFEYPITYGGRYYLTVRVWDHDDPSPTNWPSPQWTYRVAITGTPIALAPGEPVRPFYASASALRGIAGAPRGGVLALGDEGIQHISPSGSAVVVVPYAALTIPDYWVGDQLVIDGFGHALVDGHTARPEEAVIWQVPLDGGSKRRFAGGPWLSGRTGLLVGPDGDVWVGPTAVAGRPAQLWRLTPFGEIKDSIEVEGLGARALAFSPAGDLHFTGTDGVYRIAQGIAPPQRVIAADSGTSIAGLAFDRGGNIYVVADSAVVLYDADYRLRAGPFARHALLRSLSFATDAAGTPTTSLVGMVAWWKLAEMNPQGVLAAGARVGATLEPVALRDRRPGMVGRFQADTLTFATPVAGATWKVAWGRLPRGLTLDAAGVLSGTPEEHGTFVFDARGRAGERVGYARLTLHIAPQLTAELIAAAVLDPRVAATLDPAIVRSLDVNGNGVLDVADVRAYLRSRPQ
jgi:hypothetical protein